MLIKLPFFEGFYESLFCPYEYSAENELENINEDRREKGLEPIMHCSEMKVDLRSAQEAVAKNFIEMFEEAFKEAMDDHGIPNFNFSFHFKRIDRPRFYNYRSDELEVNLIGYIGVFFKKFQEFMERGKWKEEIAELLKERHESRDGFCSFYPSTIEEWLKIKEPDNVHIETALIFFVSEAWQDLFVSGGSFDYQRLHQDVQLDIENYDELINDRIAV